MPRSPLTLLVLVLTLFAFIGHLAWLDAGQSTTSFFFGVAMILVLASTACIVRDGSALDDRAFHRTRPGGDSRAFRSATLTLLGLAGTIAVLTMAHRLIYNLGWSLALWWAAAALVPLLLITAAAGTGGTLLLRGDGASTLRVLALLLAPPFAVNLLLKEMAAPSVVQYSPSIEFFPALSWLSVVGAAGYSLAWWLAAGVRRSRAALWLACLTGAILPAVGELGSLRYPEPVLPEMDLAINRKPSAGDPAEARMRERQHEQGHTPVLLDGRFSVSGLREGEFIETRRLLPGSAKPGDQSSQVSFGRGYAAQGGSYRMSSGEESLVITDRGSPEKSGRRLILESLLSCLPAPAELDLSRIHTEAAPWLDLDWLQVDERRIGIREVEASPWKVEGTVFRMEEAGNFDPLKGGWFRLPSGGSVRMFGARSNFYSTSISFRIVVPWMAAGVALNRFFKGGEFSTQPVALLHDPVTGKVRPLQMQTGWIKANGWRDCTIELDRQDEHPGDDAGEILRRSRLYLFVARPVGKVSTMLSPAS